MTVETKTVRDFVYLDYDRLNSLSAQVFGGVVPQTLKSHNHERANSKGTEESSNKATQTLTNEELVTVARQETKNVVLHDYLYTQFEESLARSILEPKNLTPSNYISVLEDAFLVKITGPAQIEDYGRFIETTDRFVEIMGDFTWVTKSAQVRVAQDLLKKEIDELQNQAKVVTGGARSSLNTQITTLQHQLKEMENIPELKKKLIEAENMPSEDFMDSLTRLFRHFTSDTFEITILPSNESGEVVFRGVLDKKLLRIHPEYLRVLYEGFVNKKWTMVGEITHFPKSTTAQKEIAIESLIENQDSHIADPNLKDMVRSLFKSLAEIDNKFFESSTRTEITLRPLAIYQETKVQVSMPIAE